MGQQPEAQRSKVPRAVGLPWLQTQPQSCEQGLFLVQFHLQKIKAREQLQALVSGCGRQKPGGMGAGPGRRAEPGGGHQQTAPMGTSNGDSTCGDRRCYGAWVDPGEAIPVIYVFVFSLPIQQFNYA